MAKDKITHLFDNGPLDHEQATESLQKVSDAIAAGEVVRFCIAVEKTDGEILTGWTNANIMQRQVIVSHLQADIILDAIKQNLE